METSLYNQQAEKIGTVQLPDSVFNVPMNADLLYQAVTSQEANRRQLLAHAKGRGEVRGGGKKPWQQKGTGRARHGSIRSPIWKGGGVTHGPTKDKVFKKKLNKKVARAALGVALSAKLRDGQVAVLDEIKLEQPKTKLMAKTLGAITSIFSDAGSAKSRPSMLVVVPSGFDPGLSRSVRNLPRIDMIEARNLNASMTLSHRLIVFLKDAVGGLVRAHS